MKKLVALALVVLAAIVQYGGVERPLEGMESGATSRKPATDALVDLDDAMVEPAGEAVEVARVKLEPDTVTEERVVPLQQGEAPPLVEVRGVFLLPTGAPAIGASARLEGWGRNDEAIKVLQDQCIQL